MEVTDSELHSVGVTDMVDDTDGDAMDDGVTEGEEDVEEDAREEVEGAELREEESVTDPDGDVDGENDSDAVEDEHGLALDDGSRVAVEPVADALRDSPEREFVGVPPVGNAEREGDCVTDGLRDDDSVDELDCVTLKEAVVVAHSVSVVVADLERALDEDREALPPVGVVEREGVKLTLGHLDTEGEAVALREPLTLLLGVEQRVSVVVAVVEANNDDLNVVVGEVLGDSDVETDELGLRELETDTLNERDTLGLLLAVLQRVSVCVAVEDLSAEDDRDGEGDREGERDGEMDGDGVRVTDALADELRDPDILAEGVLHRVNVCVPVPDETKDVLGAELSETDEDVETLDDPDTDPDADGDIDTLDVDEREAEDENVDETDDETQREIEAHTVVVGDCVGRLDRDRDRDAVEQEEADDVVHLD